MGDDTPAIQAVLDADVWRKHLLAEQDVRLRLWHRNLFILLTRVTFHRKLPSSWLFSKKNVLRWQTLPRMLLDWTTRGRVWILPCLISTRSSPRWSPTRLSPALPVSWLVLVSLLSDSSLPLGHSPVVGECVWPWLVPCSASLISCFLTVREIPKNISPNHVANLKQNRLTCWTFRLSLSWRTTSRATPVPFSWSLTIVHS